MSNSRKNAHRETDRRRRQLREQRKRKDGEGDSEYISEKFSFARFVEDHLVEVVFIMVLIMGVLFVKSFGPDRKANNAMRESVSTLVADQAFQWDLDYSYGYKIIALIDDKIVYTSYDTLPKELKINWKKVVIARIQTNQLSQTTEKIKVQMDDVYYESGGDVAGATIATSITRAAGSEAHLGYFGNYRFVIKIVQDDGNHIFCLFGLKDR